MRRRAFNFAALASCIAFTLAIIFWARGYRRLDYISHARVVGDHSITWTLASQNGGLFFEKMVQTPPPGQRWGWNVDSFNNDQPSFLLPYSHGGFFYFEKDLYGGGSAVATSGGVPWWFLMLLSAPLPIGWWIRRRRQAQRAMRGRCAGCGYDLRASTERCPEC